MSEGRKPRGRAGRKSFTDDDFLADTAPDAAVAAAYAPTSAPLDHLARNPHNAREAYDDVQELADSLAQHGQLQPVVVVARDVFLAHHPEDASALGATRWVVITGNRRHAAAQRAGLERLDMVVRDHLGGADPQMSEAMLIENIHRADLPPLLEARELQALVDRPGSSQVKVAKRLSKTQGWVSKRTSLLKLSAEAQAALRAGRLGVTDGSTIAPLTADLQAMFLAGELTPEEARRVAKVTHREQQGKLAEVRAETEGSSALPGPKSTVDGEATVRSAGDPDESPVEPPAPVTGQDGKSYPSSSARSQQQARYRQRQRWSNDTVGVNRLLTWTPGELCDVLTDAELDDADRLVEYVVAWRDDVRAHRQARTSGQASAPIPPE